MRLATSLICTAAVGLLVSVAAAQESVTAGAQLRGLDGQDHGSVSLSQTPYGVLLTAGLRGLPEGTLGFHFHERGVCEPPFESAGGHFNPTDAEHGFFNPEGVHAGDMPNIHVPASGNLQIEILNTMVSLDSGVEESLLDGDGTAIMIHSRADDYTTDPDGSAGDRIVCGVVEAATAR